MIRSIRFLAVAVVLLAGMSGAWAQQITGGGGVTLPAILSAIQAGTGATGTVGTTGLAGASPNLVGSNGPTIAGPTLTGTSNTGPLVLGGAANVVGLSISGGSTTGSNTTGLGLSITGTLNTSGIIDGASWFSNVINTASGAGTTLADWQVGGVSKFSISLGGGIVSSQGAIFTNAVSASNILTGNNDGLVLHAGSGMQITDNNSASELAIELNGGTIKLDYAVTNPASWTFGAPLFATNGTLSGTETIGSATAATASAGELGFAKISATGTAPAAGYLKIEAVAGTNVGTCKIIAYAGTSTTPTTLVDNVGGGC